MGAKKREGPRDGSRVSQTEWGGRVWKGEGTFFAYGFPSLRILRSCRPLTSFSELCRCRALFSSEFPSSLWVCRGILYRILYRKMVGNLSLCLLERDCRLFHLYYIVKVWDWLLPLTTTLRPKLIPSASHQTAFVNQIMIQFHCFHRIT